MLIQTVCSSGGRLRNLELMQKDSLHTGHRRPALNQSFTLQVECYQLKKTDGTFMMCVTGMLQCMMLKTYWKKHKKRNRRTSKNDHYVERKLNNLRRTLIFFYGTWIIYFLCFLRKVIKILSVQIQISFTDDRSHQCFHSSLTLGILSLITFSYLWWHKPILALAQFIIKHSCGPVLDANVSF